MKNKLLHYWFKFTKKARSKSINNSQVHSTSKIESGSEFNYSVMREYSYCGYNCTINNTEIGSFCSLSNNVIIGGGAHPTHWASTSPVFYAGKDSIKVKFSTHKRDRMEKTKIGSDVWIGRNVMIKPGVEIGHGAVVGMGSVVTKDIEPYTIVGGNPARFIRYRFSQSVVRELLDIKWWELDASKLKYAAQFICDVNKFIKEVKRYK